MSSELAVSSKARVLQRVCEALELGNRDRAMEIARQEYPFVQPTNVGRRYGIPELVRILFRDGFRDRYTGEPLVLPPVLRILSHMLPEAFPYHPNWKMTSTHPMYWEFSPTLDHVVPVSRGGRDDDSNWVVVSMRTNARKANWTIEELGWELLPPGDWREWDGLSQWFLAHARSNEGLLTPSMRAYRRTIETVIRVQRDSTL